MRATAMKLPGYSFASEVKRISTTFLQRAERESQIYTPLTQQVSGNAATWGSGHGAAAANQGAAGAAKKPTGPTCYICNERGHIASR